MRYISLVSLLAAMFVSGCAATSSRDDVPPIDEIDSAISEAVQISANANRAVAEVEVAVASPARSMPAGTVPPTVILPPEAVQPVTIDWQGPLEPLIVELGGRAGYSVRTTGQPPANMPMVNVVANEEPLFGVIRRTGAMTSEYADIAFNPSTRTIEIRYRRP